MRMRDYTVQYLYLGALVRRDQHGDDGPDEDARPARP